MNNELKLLAAAILAAKASSAGAFELTPTGRLHLDYATYRDDTTPLDSSFLVRRAQLGLNAKFNDDWSAKVAYDFASGGSLKDAYLSFSGWKAGEITLGQSKVPFGLEQLISSNDITFLERALPSDAFGLSRRKGIAFGTEGARHTFAAMVFGSSVGGSEASGVAARVTFTPVDHDDSLLHFGLAATIERPHGDFSFSARPEAVPGNSKLVRTGTIADVSRVNRLGLEAAWKRGPFSIQSEILRAHLGRDNSQPSLDFQGWYVGSSWVLTGESRKYKGGDFKGIVPARAGGAWELTARYSRLDLNDAPVTGGSEHNLTFGVNWYARENARVMLNYIKVNSDRRGVSSDPRIIDLRLQLSF